MPIARIEVNGTVGSNDDLPIGVQVNLSNQDIGGELTYSWEIVSQPPGTPDALNDSSLANPVFTPTREGSYLIRLVVNQGMPGRSSSDVIVVGVRQFKTRLRIPAVRETDQVGQSGWAETVNDVIRLIDEARADPGVCVCVAASASESANRVVKFDGVAHIKVGLPGAETLPRVVLANASVAEDVTGSLGLVLGPVVDGAAIDTGVLVRVRLFGAHTMLWSYAVDPGDPIYVDDAGELSHVPGTVQRQVGKVLHFVPGGYSPGVLYLWLDSAMAVPAPSQSPLLWQWNEADLSQFGAPITGGESTTLDVRAASTSEFAPGLLLSGTWSAGGATAWPINDLVIPATNRFRLSFDYTYQVSGNRSGLGLLVYTQSGSSYYGWGLGVGPADNEVVAWRIEGASGSGILPYIFHSGTHAGPGGYPVSAGPRLGATLEFDVMIKQGSEDDDTPPMPIMSIRPAYSRDGGVALRSTRLGPRVFWDEGGGSTPPSSAWNERQITRIALAIRSRNAGAYQHEIQRFHIYKHPLDL